MPTEGLWPAAGIAANPQAAYTFLGNDYLGRDLGLAEASGLRLGGYVATELNWIASGGVTPGSSVGSAALGLHALVDTQKTLNLPGGIFGIELLLSAAGRSNDDAGSVQMYTNMDSPEPRNRQDLEQIWWRQRLFDDKLLVQVGKMNPAGIFGTVTVRTECRPGANGCRRSTGTRSASPKSAIPGAWGQRECPAASGRANGGRPGICGLPDRCS